MLSPIALSRRGDSTCCIPPHGPQRGSFALGGGASRPHFSTLLRSGRQGMGAHRLRLFHGNGRSWHPGSIDRRRAFPASRVSGAAAREIIVLTPFCPQNRTCPHFYRLHPIYMAYHVRVDFRWDAACLSGLTIRRRIGTHIGGGRLACVCPLFSRNQNLETERSGDGTRNYDFGLSRHVSRTEPR
jgi:hypothetical protein